MDFTAELRPLVLVVHAEGNFREELERTLAQSGFEVRIAGNRQDALHYASLESPELAVVDLSLPARDGIELILELRLIDATTRIIALSSSAPASVAAAASALGRTTCLSATPKISEIERVLALPQPSDSPELTEVLSTCGGNLGAAATWLGLHERALRRALRVHQPDGSDVGNSTYASVPPSGRRVNTSLPPIARTTS